MLNILLSSYHVRERSRVAKIVFLLDTETS